jgi:hypothetical protein
MSAESVRLKLQHAREFTDMENLTLDLWLQLELANLDTNARTLLDAGLMLEHFTSLLDNDPAKRELDEVAAQNQLNFKLQDEVRLAENALKGRTTTATAQITDLVNRANEIDVKLKNMLGD